MDFKEDNTSRRTTTALYDGYQGDDNDSDPYDTMNLTSEQESALKEFRTRISDCLSTHLNNDFELLRWLRARNFSVDKAEVMLRKSLEWRKEWEIDSILDWNPPDVLIQYYPVGLAGYDKEGCPVWIIPNGGCNIRGLLHSCTRRDYVKYTIRVLELSLQDMRKRSAELSSPITRLNCIFDLDNFSLRHLTWKPAMDVILQLIQIYEANYPELLKCAYVVNAPSIFTVAYNILKPFLQDVTLNKIRIFGETGWKEVLQESVPMNQLPEHWGGSQRDPDGNPCCPSKICLGGEVPKSFYLKKGKLNEIGEEEIPKHDHLKVLMLPKGGKEVFQMKVTQPGTELRWEFQSDDFDVGFGITRVSTSGEEVEVLLPSQRVNSQLVPEEGSLICSDLGTYEVTFDNEFSYLRSKNIYYSLNLFPPSEHIKL